MTGLNETHLTLGGERRGRNRYQIRYDPFSPLFYRFRVYVRDNF